MHLICSSAEIVIYDDGDDENKKIDNNGYDDGTQIYIGSHDLSEYSSCGKQTSSTCIQRCSGCGLVGRFFVFRFTERKHHQQSFFTFFTNF